MAIAVINGYCGVAEVRFMNFVKILRSGIKS